MTVFLNFDDFTAELTPEGKEYAPELRITQEQLVMMRDVSDLLWGAK